MADSFKPESGTPKADSFKPDSFTPDAGPAPKGDDYGVLKGALLDMFGQTDRPGAVPLTGNKTTKTPLGVVLKPDNLGEVAVREAVMAPLSAVSMPARIAAQGAIGGAEQLLSGKGLDAAGYAGLLDATIAGLTEGAFGAAGKVASRFGRGASAFKWATEAPEKALEALRSRLPGGKWMRVPSISGGRMSADEAIDELVKLKGPEYQQARAEIANELSRLDKQRITGPKPVAGTVFNQRTSAERFDPSAMSRVADRVAKGTRSPVARSAADTAATTPLDDEGLPAGAVPALAGAENAGALWRVLRNFVR